ncbi:uncharacterized protein LOC130623694 [Hydractinia symbiolongicarpus]|uniref:uncharacterized protein LOC130623694 n=1 Tax=Hydractinia symbiolongicarpus TaxID=13093 RepID=UPI00254F2717|nr:uncharacterized protein LOC130623694 [Hydractinia symbiolongicarpus]
MHVIVICAGRTGSLSIKVALEELYKERCYHISSIPLEQHYQFLERQLKGGVSKEEWKCFYDQFCAAVGSPVAAYWRELIEVYPNAKVIVMQRESQGWYKSIYDTNITLLNYYGTLAYGISLLFLPKGIHTLFVYVRHCYHKMFGVHLNDDKEVMIRCYERFYDNLRNELESRDMVYLNYQVQDGWKPL